MLITVEDRHAVSAEVAVEQVEAYLLKTGWELHTYREWPGVRTWKKGDASAVIWGDANAPGLQQVLHRVAFEENRQPSEVVSDIVGYQVGLDRGRASVLRNSASARVVEAREALARIKPRDAAGHERARVRLAQAEAELAAATRALGAAVVPALTPAQR
ncbi:hypothetical protein [Sorangium sp. So ce233]|uniref:hypothetical protein n=1 Tax=Sorangium sp. So ce233 TaxID=3133290 RepID=UPI003F5E10C6